MSKCCRDHVDDVSIREYFEAILHEREKRMDERLVAQQATMHEKDSELTKKLAILNDLRNGVLTREEYEAKHEVLVNKIHMIEQWKANLTGRVATFSFIALVVATSFGAVFAHVVGA